MIDVSSNQGGNTPTFNFEKLYSMSETAKLIDKGIGRNKLYEFLKEKGIMMQNNEPYQSYCDQGYFKYVIKNILNRRGQVLFEQPVALVTAKGIEFIKKQLEKEETKNESENKEMN